MKQVDALAKLEKLGQPLFETKDVAALLEVEHSAANKIVSRLAASGLIIKLTRGKWALPGIDNKLALPEHLTSPYPAYISLQTALYLHGMISQIPSVTYAVSLARTRRYETPLGTFSIHHVSPDFFFGFESDQTGDVKIALPEKALVDLFYFSPTRSRLFATLPEVHIPKNFKWRTTVQMASAIHGRIRRRLAEKRLAEIRKRARDEKSLSL